MKPFEPQKNNRFLIEFNSPFDIPSYTVHKMSELNAHTIDSSGQMYWGDLTLSLHEIEQNPVSTTIYKAIKENKTNKISFKLMELNVIGDVIQTWEISAKINTISFGERDWSNDETRKVEIHLWDVNVNDINKTLNV
jgi:hypothetical protein